MSLEIKRFLYSWIDLIFNPFFLAASSNFLNLIEFLKRYFVRNVVEPIKYHVKAKKYLARNKRYFSTLSEASKVSLKLQGGIMDDKEAKNFEGNEFFEDSIKLRKFDEGAKKADLKIKSIHEYKNLLTSKLIWSLII